MDKYERRIKLLHIDADLMVGMVAGLNNCEIVRLPVFTGLPEGFGVVGVNYEPETRGFLVGIWHKSYPIVKPGCRPKIIPSGVEYKVYRVAKNKKADGPNVLIGE